MSKAENTAVEATLERYLNVGGLINNKGKVILRIGRKKRLYIFHDKVTRDCPVLHV